MRGLLPFLLLLAGGARAGVEVGERVALRGPKVIGGHTEVVQGLVYAPGGTVLSTTSRLARVDMGPGAGDAPVIGEQLAANTHAAPRAYNHLGACAGLPGAGVLVCPLEDSDQAVNAAFVLYNASTLVQTGVVAWTTTHIPWVAADGVRGATSAFSNASALELLDFVNGSTPVHAGSLALSETLHGVQGGVFVPGGDTLYLTCQDANRTLWAVNMSSGACTPVWHFNVADEIEGLAFTGSSSNNNNSSIDAHMLWVLFATTEHYTRDALVVILTVFLLTALLTRTRLHAVGAALLALIACELFIVRGYIVHVTVD